MNEEERHRMAMDASEYYEQLKMLQKEISELYGLSEEISKDIIYSAYEISCLMNSERVCSDLLSSLLRLISIPNTNYVSEDLYNKLKCARNAVESLENELQITLHNIEDHLDK